MPLFMDFHKFEKVTLDDVRSAHTADEAIQEKKALSITSIG